MPADPLNKEHRLRQKQKFLKNGLNGFLVHEVLEFLLFFSIPQGDTKPLAKELLKQFGSLSAVLDADASELLQVSGVGQHTAVLLTFLPQVLRHYMADQFGSRPRLDTIAKAGEYALSQLVGQTVEQFYLVCLDAQCRVIHSEMLHEGTIDHATIYPRAVIGAALRHNASSVILMHNHPGGSRKMSKADMLVTETILRALNPLDIEVLDHVIVAGGKYYSLLQSGDNSEGLVQSIRQNKALYAAEELNK